MITGYVPTGRKVSKEVVVVSAAWCGSCQSMKDALTRSGIVYKVIDADENMEFCRENGVRSLPTSFIYEDGEIVKTVIGNKFQEIKEGLDV